MTSRLLILRTWEKMHGAGSDFADKSSPGHKFMFLYRWERAMDMQRSERMQPTGPASSTSHPATC